MAENHSQRIRSLFWQACDRRGEDRTKFLARQCQGDGELLREVQSLLDAHDQTESPLDRPAMEQLEAWSVDGDFGPATEPDQHHGFPDRLGEFRLRQRLGRGGMGVVYLADQPSLGRQVALKLIRPEHHYFPDYRERFTREVQAAARLVHPSIVPVYEAGEHDGIPYLAMQYVRGASLAEVLAKVDGTRLDSLSGDDLQRALAAATGEQPATADSTAEVFRDGWVRACCRMIAQISDAVQHAHDSGVLHRDIKPSNIMVTPLGQAMLLDFGLARAEGVHGLTQTGSEMGSLPYMAPEQVRGDHQQVDGRTDVYGLGASLCEMLTLQPPHGQDERTRQSILAGDPPPRLGRSRSLAWEVRAVCLTALDPDPKRRYRSAGDLAGDLRNYLDRRPITARRPGLWLRSKRQVQRHPVMVGAAILTVAAVGAAFLMNRHADQREEDLRRRGINSFDTMTSTLRENDLRMAQGRPQASIEAIERALDAVDDLFGDPSGWSQAVRVRTAMLEQIAAEHSLELGDHQAAREWLARSMAAWSTVDQNNAFARTNHAFSHLIGARIARYLADSAAQSRHVDAAIALTSPGAGDNQPGSIDNIGDTMLVARAAAFTARAGFRHETDACAEAAADLQVATQSWQRVSPSGMASWRARLMRAYTELSCGRYDVLYSRHEAAISRFQAGATLIESVLEERPGHSSALETQARISLASAGSWKVSGNAAKAEQMYETAIDQATQLLAKLAIDPYRGLRASARLGYARFLLRHGRRFDAAGNQLDLAESDIDPIRMFDPITHRAAACFVRVGIAILGRAPQGEVERACAAAVDVHRALLETRPNPGNRLSLGAALANYGACLLQRNADSEAAMVLIEALALNDSAERANPSLSGVRANRQTQTKNLVAAVAKLERRGQSDAIADIAVRLQDQLHHDRELTINAVQFLCSAIGTARRQGGNAVAAEPQRIATAVAWLSTAIESSPTPVELAGVRDDPKLAVLRGHPRFDELLAGLEKRK